MSNIIQLNGAREHGRMRKVFKEYARLRYPGLSHLTEDFKHMEDAFFTGAYAMIGFSTKLPENELRDVIHEVQHDIAARKKRN